MSTRKTIATAVLAIAAAAGISAIASPATAGAAAKTADPNAVSMHRSAQTPNEVAAYWTKARMASAREVAVPVESAAAAQAAPAPTHKLGVHVGAGSLPRAAAKPTGSRLAPMTVQSGVWYNHSSMPATSIGKLYFSTPGGAAECSATVISSGNHDMIWTAGHCVSDANGHWYSNFKFVPNYYDGNSPYGAWYAKTWTQPTAYFQGGNRNDDFSAITLWPNGNGTKVADVTGSQGYWFNGGYNQTVYEFGYPYDAHPARAGFTGQQLRECYGAIWQTPAAGAEESIHCDMGHGASGGPFLSNLDFNRGWGYLVGNVSYHPSDSSDEERSPYLGDAAVNVYNAQTNA